MDLQQELNFKGRTFDPVKDTDRLGKQLSRVLDVMEDGSWRTLFELRDEIAYKYDAIYSDSGLSARLRDLRHPEFGGYDIQCRRRSGGSWEYKITIDL